MKKSIITVKIYNICKEILKNIVNKLYKKYILYIKYIKIT